MTGTESAHANAGGGFDLLRRATQAMMSRTAASEDDGSDHIGFETPRSGVATPQPDLQDKRLPSIMTSFGQVRQEDSVVGADLRKPQEFQESNLPSLKNSTESRTDSALVMQLQAAVAGCRLSRSGSSEPSSALSTHETADTLPRSRQSDVRAQHPYPTPPLSYAPSPVGSVRHVSANDLSEKASQIPEASASEPSGKSRALQASGPGSDEKSIPAENSQSSSQPTLETQHNATKRPQEAAVDPAPPPARKWCSLEGLKELTRGVMFKSGPPTPTRALSTAQPSPLETREAPGRSSHDSGGASGTQTPRGGGPMAQAPVPAAKGRLTVKIAEARGLRKCRDPYVVVVFQRSELISGGPRQSEESEALNPAQAALGGVPIQRQDSDSGRPPMAIPMRSRQSSNTSNSDYNSFRSRSMRNSFTNPHWDAQAVFDVVVSDMLVDVSVYDHSATGEEFLGHVDFQATREGDGVRGWHTLQGHADTMAENAPTGEIYVEATYQRTERRHFGPTDFEILKLIGKGTFGQVYQVRKRDTQRIYAMKVLQKKVIVQKKEVAHTVGERNILVRTAMSDSPFIVGLKFSFQTPSELYLVTDYMSGGELFWHLQKEGRFDERRAKFYIAELILAIQHLHHSDIVYRDLKPENILLDANGHIALCDFGLSKANLTKNDTTNTFCGTTEYLAPEVLLDESGYTKMVDFWSLGVLVFEMCCGWSPFYAEDTQQMYKNIAFGKVRFPRDTLSQEGRNFVKGLLNRNPKHRLGATDDAEELKRHAFFGDIDWELLAKKLIQPPFKPKLKSETDVSYFDPEFTTALDQNGSLNERAAALARGYAASTPLSPSVQANFQGFTYVDESALEDHFRAQSRDDDQDMHDYSRTRTTEDDDWDNLDDIDLRKANRMSGIVKTSGAHDEQMVGGSHFDV